MNTIGYRLSRLDGGLLTTNSTVTVNPMAGKKDYDATKKLPEGEPTQMLPKGTKVGLPTRRDVVAALTKVARKPKK